MNTATASTLETSQISDCIGYTSSNKSRIEKALNIELGKRAVQHFRDLGMIRQYTPEEAEERASKVKKQVATRERINDAVINRAIELIGHGATIRDAAGEAGINDCTLSWRLQQMGLNARKIRAAANAK